MAKPAPAAVSGAPLPLQRSSVQSTGQLDAAPASVDHALAGPGKPLEPALRQDMEQRFGHDFSRVRVHSGGAAAQSARDVNATAYTSGSNIVFGAGQFAPDMPEGRRLIAHELAHVVQQTSPRRSRPAGIQRRTQPPSLWVLPLLEIKPTNRWNDKELERLIVTPSVPIEEAFAYVGRMVGLDRRLAELDLSFAYRAYDRAIDKIFAGAGELTRFGVQNRDIITVLPYFELLKERRQRIERTLMTLYSSDARLAASPTVNAPESGWGSSPPASLLHGTQAIGDYDRRQLTSILRPAPVGSLFDSPVAGAANPPPKFEMRIPGEAEDFPARVRARAELMIRTYTKEYVTGKGAAQRADVTPWPRYQQVANAAKQAVDATFGAYAQRKAFVAGANLRDAWEDAGREQAGLNRDLRIASAKGILGGLAQSESGMTMIKEQHHALPGRAPEQGLLTSVLDDVATRHVAELLAIDRGWPGTQDHVKHVVRIQRWRVEDPGDTAHKARRRGFWDLFQTMIHEYIHSLAETNYTKFAEKQPGDIYKILIEGMTTLLTEIAYSDVDPSDQVLRTQVEGAELSQRPFDPATVPDIASHRYEQYNRALAMVGVVGLPNVYAAYFLGRIELIKHAGAVS